MIRCQFKHIHTSLARRCLFWTIDPLGENLTAASALRPELRAKLSSIFPDCDKYGSASSLYRTATTNIYKCEDGKTSTSTVSPIRLQKDDIRKLMIMSGHESQHYLTTTRATVKSRHKVFRRVIRSVRRSVPQDDIHGLEDAHPEGPTPSPRPHRRGCASRVDSHLISRTIWWKLERRYISPRQVLAYITYPTRNP